MRERYPKYIGEIFGGIYEFKRISYKKFWLGNIEFKSNYGIQFSSVQSLSRVSALGAAGVVLWGDLSFSSSEVITAPLQPATQPMLGSQRWEQTMAGP